ncbi:MAG TPA: helix-turn-helix domain-containing protein [Frankiaceae bacterium]|nr:helix-turn-helix domain-containing protein [Frankiaceae bacterium]
MGVHRVVAVAVPEVVAFDLSIPAQVFGHRDERERYSFTVCSLQAGPVPTTTAGFSVNASASLAALRRADTVIVPGFMTLDGLPPALGASLRAAYRRGARIVSICTGAFALAEAGLLDGRPATTHWRDAADLARAYPAVDVQPDVLYIDDGQVLTSAGVAAGIDLCLYIVRADHGAEAATRIARRMVVAPHRDGGQAQFIDRPITAGTQTELAGVCTWVLSHLAEELTVPVMAREAALSERTFRRRFGAEIGTTPLRWLNAQRVHEARRLLEATDLSIDEVAARSGLGSAANLRAHLARGASTTPTSYRRAFR